MITGDDIERAEKVLSLRFSVADSGNLVGELVGYVGADGDAVNGLVAHRLETIRKVLPQMPADTEPAFNTIMLHMWLCGALSQKNADEREA